MQKLKEKIEEYNIVNKAVMDRKYPDWIDYNKLIEKQTMTTTELDAFEKIAQSVLPEDLKTFYSLFGGLETNGNDESCCFMLFSIPELTRILQHEDKWCRLNSMGITDMALYSWANDRPEIAEYLSSEEIQKLNHNFKSFGWYRDSWILESCFYLYFDKNGKFGRIYYHQDYFGNFQTELEKLLNGQTETYCLEDLLCLAIDDTMNDPEGIILED